MRNLYLRAVILSALAIGAVLGAASPASANHTGFDKGEYQVDEAAGYVELTVGSSPCCPPGSGQFDYHTANLSAVAGADYQQTSGTVTTAACFCTIRVPIIGDDLFEGWEQFEVRLTNFRGTFAPERTRAVVTILDDDPKPASNPASSGRTNQQTQVTSSVASHEQAADRSSVTAGDATEPSQSNSGEVQSDEGVAAQDETGPSEDSDRPRSAASPIPESPMGPMIALGTLLGLAGAVLVVVRRRKAASNRAKMGEHG